LAQAEDPERIFVSAGVNLRTGENRLNLLDQKGLIIGGTNGAYTPLVTIDIDTAPRIGPGSDPQYLNVTYNNVQLVSRLALLRDNAVRDAATLFQSGTRSYEISYGLRKTLPGRPFGGALTDGTFLQYGVDGTFQRDDAGDRSQSGRAAVELQFAHVLFTTRRNRRLALSSLLRADATVGGAAANAAQEVVIVSDATAASADAAGGAGEAVEAALSASRIPPGVLPGLAERVRRALAGRTVAEATAEASAGTPPPVREAAARSAGRAAARAARFADSVRRMERYSPRLRRVMLAAPAAPAALAAPAPHGPGRDSPPPSAAQDPNASVGNESGRVAEAVGGRGGLAPLAPEDAVLRTGLLRPVQRTRLAELFPGGAAESGPAAPGAAPLLFALGSASPEAEAALVTGGTEAQRAEAEAAEGLGRLGDAVNDVLAALAAVVDTPGDGDPVAGTRDILTAAQKEAFVEGSVLPFLRRVARFRDIHDAALSAENRVYEALSLRRWAREHLATPQPDGRVSAYLQAFGWHGFGPGSGGPKGYVNARLVYHLPGTIEFDDARKSKTGAGIALTYIGGNIPSDLNGGLSRLTLDLIFPLR
jgi:hypothetical protein